jgi:hypothetical protein
MVMLPVLQWGETPWDNMPREALLCEMQRLYSACVSMNSVLHIIKAQHPESAFWSDKGSAGKALLKAGESLGRIHARASDGEIYQCFGRYADDLLFEHEALRWHWCVCPDGHLLANGPESEAVPLEGSHCPICKKGELRPITWNDLKPNSA